MSKIKPKQEKMLSKIQSEQTIGASNPEYFIKEKKNLIHLNDK